jgi:methionyl-tRNA formyltransferase
VLATELGIPVFQPENINDPASIERLRQETPDLIVVLAYGQILRKDCLELPRLACINIHGSLLPKYRGASPIQTAILNGDAQTGVTIQRMVRELDAGDILFQHRIPIAPETQAGDLSEAMGKSAAIALQEYIPSVEAADKVVGEAQDPALVTHCRKIEKADGNLDFTQSAQRIMQQVNAYSLWPRCRCRFRDLDVIIDRVAPDNSTPTLAPGMITVGHGNLWVSTGNGVLRILAVQPANHKRMSGGDFINGFKVTSGDRFEPIAE